MIVCIPSEDDSITDICICCLCTAKIDHLEDTLRCKTKYLDRMDAKIWLVFQFEVIFKFVRNDYNGYCTLPMVPNWTSYFEAPPSVVHLVYNGEITLACRVKHLEPFSPNGLFVHLL